VNVYYLTLYVVVGRTDVHQADLGLEDVADVRGRGGAGDEPLLPRLVALAVNVRERLVGAQVQRRVVHQHARLHETDHLLVHGREIPGGGGPRHHHTPPARTAHTPTHATARTQANTTQSRGRMVIMAVVDVVVAAESSRKSQNDDD
jgi:hypothetical protein